ncbi:MAG: MFS transporter [Desulfobacterales bacterium]
MMNTRGRSTVVVPIAITLVIQSLVSMAAVSLPVFMPAASAELNFPSSYVGLFVTLIYLGATVSSPASGYFVDRYGPICVSQICLLLSAVGLAVVSIGSVPVMMLGALIIGFGYGPVTPASAQLLVRTTPPHAMSLSFSIKQTGVPLGGAAAGAIVPHLVLLSGWRTAGVAVSGVCVLLMLFLHPFRKHYDRDLAGITRFSYTHMFKSLKMIFSEHALRQIAVASFFFVTMQLFLISFLVTYLAEDIGMTLVRAGIMLSAAQSAGIIGRIAWGALADRYHNSRFLLAMLGIVMAVMSVVAALFSPAWPHPAILAVCVLFGSVAIGWNGVYLAEVTRLVRPEYAAMATGGSLFFTYCGVLMGLPAFSLIVDKTGSYAAGFYCAAVATSVCGVILWLSRSSGARNVKT